MVEPGRSAAAREGSKKGAGMTKSSKAKKAEKKQSREAAGSPSYRLALRSIFSCRNSTPDGIGRSKKQPLGCASAPSICKQGSKDTTDDRADEGEPCKRRASVSGGGERCVKKPPSSKLQAGGGSASSSSSTGGSSFRAGMQLRRLSGCYECHMVVDPGSGVSSSTRGAICPCPDCGEVFVRQESLQRHQSIRHAVSELGAEDTSRDIIEIIFQSSWLKKQSPVCSVERILKVHNTARTLARFEDYRDAVKARAKAAAAKEDYPRCTADGNELLRFRCAALRCPLGLQGATHLCDDADCDACAVIRDGFVRPAAEHGIRTMATSGRAHDAVAAPDEEHRTRAMLLCRVIAGRVRRPPPPPPQQEQEEEDDDDASSDSVAGSAGVYSSMEELLVFNPTAILPCFVVIYKA